MAVRIRLTILFDEPFWIGLYERSDGEACQVCKITFGAEPKDYEVYEFFLRHWNRLCFSPPVKAQSGPERRTNPKRLQRRIRAQLEQRGFGTKAQQALKLQQEQGKTERKRKNREQKEAERERRYALREEKKKAKHRGK